MRDLSEITKEYSNKKKEIIENFEAEMKETLEELCKGYLDVAVIHKNSNLRGVLKIEASSYQSFEVRFYPYLKDGSRISKRCEARLYTWRDNESFTRALLSDYEIVEG